MGNSQIPDAVAAMLQASFEYQPVDGDTLARANACLPGAVGSTTSSSTSNLPSAPPPCPPLGEMARMSKEVHTTSTSNLPSAPPPCPPLGEMARMSKDVGEIDPTQRKRRKRNGTVMETAARTVMRFHL